LRTTQTYLRATNKGVGRETGVKRGLKTTVGGGSRGNGDTLEEL